nr:hypothetical protein [uncultured Romboutsia sp.]
MSRIVLTFKNNDKEKAIESFLDSKVSPTAYIKELVWEAMNNGTIIIPVISEDQDKEEESIKKSKPKVGGFR